MKGIWVNLAFVSRGYFKLGESKNKLLIPLAKGNFVSTINCLCNISVL